MFRGNMTQIIKEKWEKLGKSADMLDLNQKEFDQIFNRDTKKEQVYLTIGGPIPYTGGYYGTISIKDF
jgi:hypothetical protein